MYFVGPFKDIDDDDVMLGDGSHSTYLKLLDRNNYLNRPHKRYSELPSFSKNIKYRKLATKAKAGCVNWQPLNETCTTEVSRTNIKEKLQLVVQKLELLDDEEKKQITTDLETTFCEQRTYLNKSQVTKSDILKEWPILFIHDYMLWHYE